MNRRAITFSCLALALLAAFFAQPSRSADPAAVAPRVFLKHARVAWTAASGPVAVYQLDKKPEGSADWVPDSLRSPELYADLQSPLGVTFRVRVAGVDSAARLGPFSQESAPVVLLGARCDVKGDGLIRAASVMRAIREYVSQPPVVTCDMDGDGLATLTDIELVASYFANRWCDGKISGAELRPYNDVCPTP